MDHYFSSENHMCPSPSTPKRDIMSCIQASSSNRDNSNDDLSPGFSDESSSTSRTGERGRSPVQVPSLFVSRLYEMLRACDQDKTMGEIVSWLPDGLSFKVHQPNEVIKDILPAYFNQTKYKSFQRQLNLWGFDRITTHGPARGGYIHPDFQRDLPLCVSKLHRVRAVQRSPTTTGRRRPLENADDNESMMDDSCKNMTKKSRSSRAVIPSNPPLQRHASVISNDSPDDESVQTVCTLGSCTIDSLLGMDIPFLASVDAFFDDHPSSIAVPTAAFDVGQILDFQSVFHDGTDFFDDY